MAAWFIPAAVAAANLIGGFIGQGQQSKHNMKLAAFQHDKNMELLKYQLNYNTPAQQMARFKDAGLNPNLVYGQGSAGNMQSAPQYPNIQPTDMMSVYTGIGTQLQQMKLMQSQTDLNDQKVAESGVKQDLMKSQQDLVKANPYMRQEYVNAMVTQLQQAARIKENEANVLTTFQKKDGQYSGYSVGQEIILKQLELLTQRFNLNNADQQIKAKVLESKEFQNALQELQVQWMKDGDITPQHIYQGIMMLLSKMM